MRRLRLTLFILTILALPALAQDAPPPDTSGITVTEVAQLDRRAGPGSTSAHLSPDGQRILHINGDSFCLLTLDGTEEACYTLSEQTGVHPALLRPDHDTVTWSPDGRFVAYTVEGWRMMRDMDIWLFAADTGQLTNLTDDEFDGAWLTLSGDEVPDTVLLDYAPAWKPDGTLTFVRNRAVDIRRPAELWSLRLGDAEPVKVADLHRDDDEIGTVMSMDWSADGSTLAYTLYHRGGQGGLWLYDSASGQTEMLLADDRQTRGDAMRATFSPDASQILLLTSEREQFAADPSRDGHYIVSAESGEFAALDPEVRVMSAGWFPDGSGLIYTGRSADFTEDGVYVTADPTQHGRLALSGTIGEDEGPYIVYAPTNRVSVPLRVAPDGTMLLGTSVAPLLIVARVEGLGPIPVYAQAAPEAQATDLPLMTDEPRITVAPPATETPTIDAGAQAAGAFTAVREVARLPFPSGRGVSSSHLLPDGETLINVQRNVFCEYTLAGEELWCVEATYHDGEEDRRLPVDPETITMSPDSRYLAFSTDGMILFRDPDIWVLDLETQQLANLTDDGYDGPMASMDESSGTAHVDLAPAWRPDGMLSFARHSVSFNDAAPSLWIIDPAGGDAEKLADFEATFDAFNFVMDMDWSPDGSRLAFILDSQANPSGGLWLYETEAGDMRPLVVPPEKEGFLTAEFSPDSQSILLQTVKHATVRGQRISGTVEDNDYFVVSLDGSARKAQAPLFIQSAGWLPDGSLIYLLYQLDESDSSEFGNGGVFIAASASETAEKVMDLPTLEDHDNIMLFGPTPRQWPMLDVTGNGKFVVGSTRGVTLVLEAHGGQMMDAAPVPSATATPEPETSAETVLVSMREVARLPVPTDQILAHSLLRPDGETVIHIHRNAFCAHSLAGEQLWCIEATYHNGEEERVVPVDPKSATISPDGRYLAFTTKALEYFTDSDIWLLDLETREYTNVTDDGYDRYIGPFGSTPPDTAHVDLAPAWRHDGMLTFARHSPMLGGDAPSLWVIDPAGSEPEKLADFEPSVDALNVVIHMNWSSDGSRMAFILDSLVNPFGGLWVYEVEDDNMRPLIIPPTREGFISAYFSPDGQSILLETKLHSAYRTFEAPGAENNNYYVVSLDGRPSKVQAPMFIMQAGWLPDGSLVSVLYDGIAPDSAGVFVALPAAEQPVKVMPLPVVEGWEPGLSEPWPMSIQSDGRFIVGAPLDMILVIETVVSDGAASSAPMQETAAATASPEPETSAELGPVSVSELARVEVMSGPAATSSRLLPDGETLIHAQMNKFCAYTLESEEQWCVEIIQQAGDSSRPVRIDAESITMSDDGRYLAFTSDALRTFNDPDIWVLDLETQEYANLTDDNYDGGMMLSDNIPDALPIDLAPSWRPDGMLTFARHTHNIRETIPSLWMVDPEGGAPEKLADFEGVPGNFNLVISMDWSPDGSRMTFVLDHLSNPFGGLWLYEADKDNMKPLVIPRPKSPGFLRADFSPDGESILLMTMLRDRARFEDPSQVPDQTGYYVVSADTGKVTPVQADTLIMGIGWLPDSRLLYVGRDPMMGDGGGIFVMTAQGGETEKVMALPEHDGAPLNLFSPTPSQWTPIQITADGRFALGSAGSITPVFEAAAQ